MDFILALVAMLVLSPILLVIMLFLLIANKGAGAVFTQERPGKNTEVFKLVKFKTMTDEKDDEGEFLPDKERLTRVGRFIRSLSLDELPQLYNVLKGDMSLVGPRPLLIRYLPLYSPEQARRHEVRPGITGWAQVNGRNAISWEGKFKYDVFYVDNISFTLDLKILWLTFLKVIKSEGINADKDVTMKPFIGYSNTDSTDLTNSTDSTTKYGK